MSAATQRPLVTVLIINWNRIIDLKETLQNISLQSYTPLEVLIIDNASSDGSADMVEREFPTFKVIRNKQNLGAVPACNQGLRLAHGEIVIKMDNDAVFERRDAIATIVEAFNANPRVGIVSPCVRNYYTHKKENGPDNHFIFAAVGIRRSILEEAGFLPEIFFIYAEEEDFTLRVEDCGYTVIFLSELIALHKSAPSQRSAEMGYRLKTRNVFWVFWRNYPFWMAVQQTLRHALLTFYVALKTGRLRPYFRSVFDAFVQIRTVIRDRRPLRSARTCIIYPEPFLPWMLGRLLRPGLVHKTDD